MKLPGIQNTLAALAAVNPASGGKPPAPSSNAMRAEPPASFKQALSHEVAQRQNGFQPPAQAQAEAGARAQPTARPQQAAARPAPQRAAKPQQADKTKPADKPDPSEAPAPEDATATATADASSATPAGQASDAKPEDSKSEDSAASLADIPGAPQAALMMQLMSTTPAALAAPAAEAAPAAGAAKAAGAAEATLDGKAAGKGGAARDPVDLRAAAGKADAAGAGQAAAQDAAASADLQAAFGKAMNDAGQQAAQTINAAQAEAPAANAAPAALAALQAAVQAAHAPADHVDKLTPAVGTPAWDQALGQRIVWMAEGGEQSATLTMNPPDLGPMQVVLSVSNNQATVDFMSAQPEVRQALENALPRLREMMSESGVQLGQANVSAGSQQQFAGFGAQNNGGRAAGRDSVATDDGAPQLRQGVVRIARDGVVDTFA